MAATNQPTTSGFVDATLSNQELRNSLARAVESSGTGRQAVTRFNDVEQEVSNVFRPGSATLSTSNVLPTLFFAGVFIFSCSFLLQITQSYIFVG